ncbi:MAG: universal stress protein [Halothiobacillaceae bacterium]
MSESEHPTQDTTGTQQLSRPTERPNLRHVLACVDASPSAPAVLAHAAAMAEAAGARMTIMHVLESPADQEPMDPVEWALRHRNAITYLQERKSQLNDLHAEAAIVAGPPAERINTWAHDNAVDLIVLGRGSESDGLYARLGDTARRVAEDANASVLLVPSMQVGDKPIRYRKMLIPLDGSSRSECVLPLGLEIAAAHEAELLLVHAAPKADIFEADLLDAEAIALRDQLYRHNERAARQYLDWIRSLLFAPPVSRTRLLPSGDVRRSLARTAVEEQIDLIVLSAAGKSGHADMAVGSVADYLINRMNIPVLLVRQHKKNLSATHRKLHHAMDTRPPSQGMM